MGVLVPLASRLFHNSGWWWVKPWWLSCRFTYNLRNIALRDWFKKAHRAHLRINYNLHFKLTDNIVFVIFNGTSLMNNRITGSSVDPSRVVFFKVFRWQFSSFQLIEGSRLFFPMQRTGNKLCSWASGLTIKLLIWNWLRARKASQVLQGEREVQVSCSFAAKKNNWLCLAWSHVVTL